MQPPNSLLMQIIQARLIQAVDLNAIYKEAINNECSKDPVMIYADETIIRWPSRFIRRLALPSVEYFGKFCVSHFPCPLRKALP